MNKLQDYSLISNELIEEIDWLLAQEEDNRYANFEITLMRRKLQQLIPSIQLAEKCYDAGCNEGASNSSYYAADENKKHFLNSEII